MIINFLIIIQGITWKIDIYCGQKLEMKFNFLWSGRELTKENFGGVFNDKSDTKERINYEK